MRKPTLAFTLIELLVVVAILALLMAILLPSLSRARAVSQRAACGAQLRGVGSAFATYAGYNDDILPYTSLSGNGGSAGTINGIDTNPGSTWTSQNLFSYRENCWAGNNGPSGSRSAHPFNIVLAQFVGGTNSKSYACPGTGGVNPANLLDAATKTPWMNPATGKPVSGASTKRLRSSYLWSVNDMGNYLRDNATMQTYYLGSAYVKPRYLQSQPSDTTGSGAPLYEGFNLFRKRFSTLKPGTQLVQDINALDGSIGDLVVTNHPTSTASLISAEIVPGSNPTAQAAYYVVNSQTQSGSNHLYADGSVAFLGGTLSTRVYSPIFLGNTVQSSIFVGTPINFDANE